MESKNSGGVALEYDLLHRCSAPYKSAEIGRVGGDQSLSESRGAGAGAGASIGQREAVGYSSKWGNTIAVADLQGQTAPEPDWYSPIEFVCMHCLQPARGLVFGNPVGAEKCPDTGRTIWVVRGRFGSPACALRYLNDHRYTFAQETMGLLPLMLIRAYGYKGLLTDLPMAPARVELPPFQPQLVQKWARSEIQFDGLSFHNEYNRQLGLQPPDRTRHFITSDHCAVLIDAQVNRDKLTFNAHQLQTALPNLHTKPRPPPSRK